MAERKSLSAALQALSIIAATLSLTAGAWIVSTTFVSVYQSHFWGPVLDFWKFLPTYQAALAGEDLWPLLVEAHGSHRLVLPRLFYLAEYSLFEGRNVFLVSSSLVLHLILVGVLIRATLHRDSRLSIPEKFFSVGLIGALAFSSTQLWNFAIPWNIHWFLCCTAALLSISCVISIRRAWANSHAIAGWLWLCVAILAGWCGNYSMGNGLLIWPVLFLVAFILQTPKRFLVGIAVAGSVIIPVFRGNLGGNVGRRLAEHPWEIGAWFLKCLGSPVTASNETLGMVLAGIGSLAGIALAIHIVRNRAMVSAGEALFFGLLAFSWSSVLLTSLGRLNDYATTPRYQTIVLLFWLSLVLLALHALHGREMRQRIGRLAVMLVVSAWLCGFLLSAHRQAAEKVEQFSANVRSANTAMLVGVRGRSEYGVLISQTDHVKAIDRVGQFRSFLSDERLGAFSEGLDELIGRKLPELFPQADSSRCRGSVREPAQRVMGSSKKLRIQGWVSDASGGRVPRLILFTSQDGAVVGLARLFRQKFDPFGWGGGSLSAWHGYASADRGPFDVWAILESKEACRIVRKMRSPSRSRSG